MRSATLQAKIAAFESLANHPHTTSPSTAVVLSSNPPRSETDNLLETPISPITAQALPPAVELTVVNAQKSRPPQVSPSPSPPNLGRKTSLIDLKDWIVEDGFSESSNGIHRPRFARNGHHRGEDVRPPPNGTTSRKDPGTILPLISLESPPNVKPKPKHLVSKPIAADFNAPALPPRKLKPVASSSSLKSSSTSYLYPPRHSDILTMDRGRTSPPKLEADFRLKGSPSHIPTSSMSSFHSVSLSSDSSTPSLQHISTFPLELDQERDLSVQSYGSDSVSLSESYEEVSSSAAASPATERLINLDWERASAQRNTLTPTQPPRLPHRPALPSMVTPSTRPSLPRPPPPQTNPRSTPSSPIVRPSLSLTSANLTSPRHVPPVPSRSSDRSSIRSSVTSDSSFSVNYPTYQPSQSKSTLSPPPLFQTPNITQPSIVQKTRRPTPVPPKARKRYETLFNVNIIQQRRAEKQRKDKPALLSPAEARRSRQGWRGLSIDLTTTQVDRMGSNAEQEQDGSDELNNTVINDDEVLSGRVVRCIWIRSGLDKPRLREIWNECDTEKKGVLDRESFVRGIWKIDEELRRAHAVPLRYKGPSQFKLR